MSEQRRIVSVTLIILYMYIVLTQNIIWDEANLMKALNGSISGVKKMLDTVVEG